MTGIALFLGLMMVSLTATASGKSVAANDEDEVFMTADKMPVFPGGEAALMEFIREGISYPPEAADRNAEGRVIVQFVVDKTGQVGDVKVVRSVDADLDREAVRVVQTLPAFTPAFRLGKPVSVWYTLPVNFKLENDISYVHSYIHEVDSIKIDYCNLNIDTPYAITPDNYDAGQLSQSRKTVLIKRKWKIREMVNAMGALAKLSQGHLDTRGKITLYFNSGRKNVFYYDQSSLYFRGNYYDITTFTAAGAEFRKILFPLIHHTE
jgi:TonB family protein